MHGLFFKFTLFQVFHTPVHLSVAKFCENWPQGQEILASVRKYTRSYSPAYLRQCCQDGYENMRIFTKSASCVCKCGILFVIVFTNE